MTEEAPVADIVGVMPAFHRRFPVSSSVENQTWRFSMLQAGKDQTSRPIVSAAHAAKALKSLLLSTLLYRRFLFRLDNAAHPVASIGVGDCQDERSRRIGHLEPTWE